MFTYYVTLKINLLEPFPPGNKILGLIFYRNNIFDPPPPKPLRIIRTDPLAKTIANFFSKDLLNNFIDYP